MSDTNPKKKLGIGTWIMIAVLAAAVVTVVVMAGRLTTSVSTPAPPTVAPGHTSAAAPAKTEPSKPYVIYGLVFHLPGCPEIDEDPSTASTTVSLKNYDGSNPDICHAPPTETSYPGFTVWSASQFSYNESPGCRSGVKELHQAVSKGTRKVGPLTADYSETTLCQTGSPMQETLRTWTLPDGGVITTVNGRDEGNAPMDDILSKVTKN